MYVRISTSEKTFLLALGKNNNIWLWSLCSRFKRPRETSLIQPAAALNCGSPMQTVGTNPWPHLSPKAFFEPFFTRHVRQIQRIRKTFQLAHQVAVLIKQFGWLIYQQPGLMGRFGDGQIPSGVRLTKHEQGPASQVSKRWAGAVTQQYVGSKQRSIKQGGASANQPTSCRLVRQPRLSRILTAR